MVHFDGGKAKQRVVVIGAGIVGASIAFNLSRRTNVDVTVIDHAQPGTGASSHSFAWINAFSKEPPEYGDLNRRSQNMWDRLARRLNADIGLRWGGEIRWVSTEQAAWELHERVKRLQGMGYATRLIDEDELRHLEPRLKVGKFTSGEFSDNDAHVDPPKVVDACLKHVEANGGAVHANTTVVGFTTGEGSRISAVRTQVGDIECDAVVAAAGLGTTKIAELAGIDLSQQESPGMVGKTTPVPPIFHTASVLHTPRLNEGRGEIHIRQYADGTLMIGEGSQESVSDDDSQEHADDLLARAIQHVPAIEGAKITPVPVGYRPMPMDGLPVLGFAEAVPNMYLAVMHSGVTLAAAIGEFSTIEIADGTKVDMLERYRLERFSLVS